jgi:hypothetical protein
MLLLIIGAGAGISTVAAVAAIPIITGIVAGIFTTSTVPTIITGTITSISTAAGLLIFFGVIH